MGNTYPIGKFTVTYSNPGTTVVRFVVTDDSNHLSTTKLLRSVLGKAIDTWVAANRSALDSVAGKVADADVKGSDEYSAGGAAPVGGGFSKFTFTYSGKKAEVTLNSTSGVTVSGTYTSGTAIDIPYADVT